MGQNSLESKVGNGFAARFGMSSVALCIGLANHLFKGISPVISPFVERGAAMGNFPCLSPYRGDLRYGERQESRTIGMIYKGGGKQHLSYCSHFWMKLS
jgi:hypothetical protein